MSHKSTFIPDPRNKGGRNLIVNLVNNHQTQLLNVRSTIDSTMQLTAPAKQKAPLY